MTPRRERHPATLLLGPCSGQIRPPEAWTMNLEGLLREKREEILRICAKYGARNVRIFGSVGRGEADEQSDIDFLVELEPGRSLFDSGGLQYELERLLRMPRGCGDRAGPQRTHPPARAQGSHSGMRDPKERLRTSWKRSLPLSATFTGTRRLSRKMNYFRVGLLATCRSSERLPGRCRREYVH